MGVRHMDIILIALADIMHWWWLIPLGVAVGVFVGAVPGFSSTNTLIILLPLTLGMETGPGLGFMASVYSGAQMGGSIPAILLNVPGTGSAAATCLDGYPMAQQGKAQQALIIAFLASCIGGFLTTGATLFLLPYLRAVVYLFGSIENFVVILFGLALIAQIAGKNPIKGYLAGIFGLLIGAIGYDSVYSVPRATFGILQLFDGIPRVPAIVGLFALSEALIMIEKETIVKAKLEDIKHGWNETKEGIRLTFKHFGAVVRSGFIGFVIGIIPGAGATIGSFVSYQQAYNSSKEKETFGHGNPEGIIAAEAANNGLTSGALIPLLTLGIPGGGSSAVMLIVLLSHGVPIGPRLFQLHSEIAYSVILAMFLAYVALFIMGMPLMKGFAKIAIISTKVLVPTIIFFVLVGAFVERRFFFDMKLALLFGILGYIIKKTGYPIHSVLLGVILGPLAEKFFLRAIMLGNGNPAIFFSRPVANVLWLLLFVSIAAPPIFKKYFKKEKTNTAS